MVSVTTGLAAGAAAVVVGTDEDGGGEESSYCCNPSEGDSATFRTVTRPD